MQVFFLMALIEVVQSGHILFYKAKYQVALETILTLKNIHFIGIELNPDNDLLYFF